MNNENKEQATPPPIEPKKKKGGLWAACIVGALVVLGIIGTFSEDGEEGGGGGGGNWKLAGRYFEDVFAGSTEDEGVAYYNSEGSPLKVLQATKAGCLVESTERGHDRTIWVETKKRYEDGQRLDKGYYVRRGLFEYESALGAERTVARYVDVTDKGIKLEEKAKKDVLEQLGTDGNRTPGDTVAITLPGGATMEMVWCPPGTFLMGSPEDEEGRSYDETQHRVTLSKGFWMAKTEVTQKQWKSVMGNNPSHFKGDDLPVEEVSWNDCQLFCRKTGLQLPTEAQWEYACRAEDTGPFAAGGWCNADSEGHTHPVGQKEANDWGLYDMHGNVWEWCQDWYGSYPNHAVTDPQEASSGSGRVRRGGSWGSLADYCRSANRRDHYYALSLRDNDLGFRPVLCQD